MLRRPLFERPKQHFSTDEASNGPSVTIDQSLTKLFNCMTLAYRYISLLIHFKYSMFLEITCSSFFNFQTLKLKVDIASLEKFQRIEVAVERQDSS